VREREREREGLSQSKEEKSRVNRRLGIILSQDYELVNYLWLWEIIHNSLFKFGSSK
jgi:hypothetical protein